MDDKIVFAFDAKGSDGLMYRIISVHSFLEETNDYESQGTLQTEDGDLVLGSDSLGWEIDVIPRIKLTRLP
ncbi:hypothetical protein SH449x_003556 [Pirellulaceae bacterium SH449]